MTHYFSFLNPGSVSMTGQSHEKVLAMIQNQSILNCTKTIALYRNISMCMGHGTAGIPPPLCHTFGVVPRKLGWKPTYYSPQLST